MVYTKTIYSCGVNNIKQHKSRLWDCDKRKEIEKSVKYICHEFSKPDLRAQKKYK